MGAEGVEIHNPTGIKFSKNDPPIAGHINASAIFVFSFERVVVQKRVEFVLEKEFQSITKGNLGFARGLFEVFDESRGVINPHFSAR